MAGLNSDLSFQSERNFRDQNNFPYGFARSGEFTIQQAQLIEKHGCAYQALASGDREPANPDEEAFLEYCLGRKEAETLHERTWKRYLDKVNRSTAFYSLARTKSPLEDNLHSLPDDELPMGEDVEA